MGHTNLDGQFGVINQTYWRNGISENDFSLLSPGTIISLPLINKPKNLVAPKKYLKPKLMKYYLRPRARVVKKVKRITRKSLVEIGWWSVSLRPTLISYEQVFDVGGVNSKLQSSGVTLLGLGASTHFWLFKKWSTQLDFAYGQKQTQIRSQTLATKEYRFNTQLGYRFYQNDSLSLTSGLGIHSSFFPYFSVASLTSTKISIENASLTYLSPFLRIAYVGQEKDLATFNFSLGAPVGLTASGDDAFKSVAGYRFGLEINYKRIIKEKMFWEVGSWIHSESIKYNQVEPFSAKNSIQYFQHQFRLGVGSLF